MNRVDYTNQTVNGFKILQFLGRSSNKDLYKVICRCGKERTVKISDIKKLKTKKCSCNSFNEENVKSGDKFGILTLVKKHEVKGQRKYYEFLSINNKLEKL